MHNNVTGTDILLLKLPSYLAVEIISWPNLYRYVAGLRCHLQPPEYRPHDTGMLLRNLYWMDLFVPKGFNFKLSKNKKTDLYKWAVTWQNQQSECAPSKDSDQPWHPPSLISSSLSAWRKLGSLATHWTHSEDSYQTGQMPRLIWAFARHTLILLVLSCRGSNFCWLTDSVTDTAKPLFVYFPNYKHSTCVTNDFINDQGIQ